MPPFFLLLHFFIHSIRCTHFHYNDSSYITNDIFVNYDKTIAPFENHPVHINMTIVLGILIELILQRENEQLASYVISHTQRWTDRRLRWNPAHYNGQIELIVPQTRIWIPKLFVYNSVETKEMQSPSQADARLRSDGSIKVNIPQFVSGICRIQTQSFPFDSQFCAVALASPLLNTREMTVNTENPPSDSYFAGNAEWHLFNITVRHMNFVEEGEERVEVHYIFHLQRRPIYYITVIVAPTFLISALSILGIFSPGSSDGPRNEKVSLGLGSLLAMTVLLGIVAGAMPKSNSIPLLGYYILVVICLCAVAVSISMGFLAMSKYYIHRDLVPNKKILHMLLFNQVRRKSTMVKPFTSIVNTDFKESEIPVGFKRIQELLEDIAAVHRMLRRKKEQNVHKRKVELEWSSVFQRFDYVFLFIFEVLNLMALAGFLRFAWLPTPELREQIL